VLISANRKAVRAPLPRARPARPRPDDAGRHRRPLYVAEVAALLGILLGDPEKRCSPIADASLLCERGNTRAAATPIRKDGKRYDDSEWPRDLTKSLTRFARPCMERYDYVDPTICVRYNTAAYGHDIIHAMIFSSAYAASSDSPKNEGGSQRARTSMLTLGTCRKPVEAHPRRTVLG
jgi:hypothetical protein